MRPSHQKRRRRKDVFHDVLFVSVSCFGFGLLVQSDSVRIAKDSSDAGINENAHVTFVDNFPWLVKLYTVAAFRCSGVLIAPNWVLTSASCFDKDVHANHYHVKFSKMAGGSANGSSARGENWPRTEPWEQIPQIVSTVVTSPAPSSISSSINSEWYADAYFLHGRYTSSSCHNLALLRLLKNVTAPFSPAQLSRDAKLDVCYSVGWGTVNGNGTMEPEQPTVRNWTLIRTTNCSCLSGDQPENDRLLAEPLYPRTGPCPGDMGSPLMCKDPTDDKWKVTALVSQLWRCPALKQTGQEPQLATFLDLSYYIPFIEKLQRKNPPNPDN